MSAPQFPPLVPSSTSAFTPYQKICDRDAIEVIRLLFQQIQFLTWTFQNRPATQGKIYVEIKHEDLASEELIPVYGTLGDPQKNGSQGKFYVEIASGRALIIGAPRPQILQALSK